MGGEWGGEGRTEEVDSFKSSQSYLLLLSPSHCLSTLCGRARGRKEGFYCSRPGYMERRNIVFVYYQANHTEVYISL